MQTGFWFTADNYLGMCASAAGATDLAGLVSALACGGRLLLRPYYKGNPTPRQVAQQIMSMRRQLDTSRFVVREHVYYQVGNEPNLPHEQWRGGLEAYAAFFQDVRKLVPPQVKLAWAGMSPGTDDWLDWYTAANTASPNQPDAVVAHVYGLTYEDLVALTTRVLRAVSTLPVIIGECNFGPGAGIVVDRNAWAIDAWDRYLTWTRIQSRILFTLYFAYTWDADMPVGTPVDAKGTYIVHTTIRRAIEGARMGPPGRSWWVWYIENCGGVQGIVNACRTTESRAVFIKGGDGPSLWSQVTRQVVDDLAAAGVDVYLWHYAYLGRIDGTPHEDRQWTVQDEIACVGAMLEQAGPNIKGLVVDAEAETEGRADQANIYALAVRRLLGNKFFAYSPLPVIDYHQALPYAQFNQVCDAVMPQFYSENIGGDPPWTMPRLVEQWDRWMRVWKASNQRVPDLMPVGESYGLATPTSVQAFDRLAHEREWAGWSYWSLEHAIADNLVAVLATNPAPTPPPTQARGLITLEPDDLAAARALFDAAYQAAEGIHSIYTKYGIIGTRTGAWFELGIKSSVSQAKELAGLQAE